MKQIDTPLEKASVVIAGGACWALVLGRLFSTYAGIAPVPGLWLVTQLAIPMLCLWCGMLVHDRIGRPKPWIPILVGLLAAGTLAVQMAGTGSFSLRELFSLLFYFLLGILLPWNHIRENGDKIGAKSALLCLLTALSYAALRLVQQRLDGGVMRPENADMEELFKNVLRIVRPLASVLPLLFATEFAFSRAGQWLGSRKWFFWLSVPVAVFCFIAAMLSLSWIYYPYGAVTWIRFLVQPVTVCLILTLWGFIKNKRYPKRINLYIPENEVK